MRKNLFEKIDSKPISYLEEITRIEFLFSKDLVIGSRDLIGRQHRCTIEQYIDAFLFKNWKYRSTYLCIDEVRQDLKITERDLATAPTQEDLLAYFEFVANMLLLIKNRFNYSVFFYLNRDCLDILRENLTEVLEKINYKIVELDFDKIIIVARNENADAVAENFKDIGDKVIEYNRTILHGDIAGKREILLVLGDKFEPLRKTLKGHGFGDLESNIGFLLNSINIRHNNKEGTNKNKFVVSAKPEELEKWYDTTYELLLLAFLAVTYINKKTEIDNLKAIIAKK
ncbi:hypothetical protein [Desulforamulus reducens]|uniref:hypothetical protein n=1 Tax=Desulforamulus reducens TaxID=59610 RepID=UPI00059C96D6|nr:hypothetical protein [Desulforamulus reducens]